MSDTRERTLSRNRFVASSTSSVVAPAKPKSTCMIPILLTIAEVAGDLGWTT